MRLEPLDEVQIESIVSKAIQDAVDFIDGEIAPQRIKAQRYFDGEVDIGFEEGRSRVVATKCREVVRGMKPSIQRIFLTSEKPVEFVPRGPEDVQSSVAVKVCHCYARGQLLCAALPLLLFGEVRTRCGSTHGPRCARRGICARDGC